MRNWFANYSKPRDEAWGYAQWKPVMYTSTQRKNADLSHATSYPNIAVDQKYLTSHHLPDRSMFHAYFLHDYDEVSSVSQSRSCYSETNIYILSVAVAIRKYQYRSILPSVQLLQIIVLLEGTIMGSYIMCLKVR